MIQITNKAKCSGCHACANICPKSCITMERDGEGFLYPHADLSACIECGLCENVCPITKPLEHSDELQIAYAAYNIDDNIRLGSSSGGIFTLLAEYVIKNGGVVFGAALNGKFEVEHKKVDSACGLELLRGSKYSQSAIGDSYKEAKRELESGRTVLFTGTPCQIYGLKKYLNKDYDNLITQDIICHGVPSPTVWEKYIKFRESLSEEKTRKISFRHKNYGWKRFSMRFEFSNNSEYMREHDKDPFMKAFLQNFCLRPSCYDCAFKTIDRVADITLADYWGIHDVLPELDDDKGVSLVVLHSKKGEEIFRLLEKSIKQRKTEIEKAVKYNPAMIISVKMPRGRDAFLSEISDKNFDKTVNKFTKVSFKNKLIGKLRRIFK